MSEFVEEPRFTIEQVDLLQRLRRSGMARRHILHAVDTLERLDREHGDKFGRRRASSSSSSSGPAHASSSSCNGADAGFNGAEGGEGGGASARVSTSTQTLFRPGPAPATLSPSPSNSFDPSPPPAPPPASALVPSSPVSMATLAHNGRETANGKLSPPRYALHSALGGRGFGFDAAEDDLEVDDKVEELMR